MVYSPSIVTGAGNTFIIYNKSFIDTFLTIPLY